MQIRQSINIIGFLLLLNTLPNTQVSQALPNQSDEYAKYAAQITNYLKVEISHALPEFLKKMHYGQNWLDSYTTLIKQINKKQEPDFSKLSLIWSQIPQEKGPSTLFTKTAKKTLNQISDQKDIKSPKKITDTLDAIAKELVFEIEALNRIERYRRRDVNLTVKQPDGFPAQNVTVKINQSKHHFLFGCNIYRWNDGNTKEDRLYKQRFAELLNYATLGFYWASYEPQKGSTREDHWRQVAKWCKAHDIERKGHPLVWNYADPRWLPDDPQKVFQLQMSRVKREVSHFAEIIDMWDVVNEATAFDRNSFWERSPKLTAMWEKIGQFKMPQIAFETARQANPEAMLVINDYYLRTREDAEKDRSIRSEDREIYEDVIRSLKDKAGKPLYDVIGIQSHMHGGAWSTERILNVIDRFAEFNVPLHFTETTIVSGSRVRGERRWGETTEKGEIKQAEEIERFYRTVYSKPEVEALTWWDFSDDRAWQGAPAGLVRKDMSPKPAYEKLMSLIKGTWWTNEKAQTDSNGKLTIRAFTGTHEVNITTDSGKTIKKTFVLNPGKQAKELTLNLEYSEN